MRGGDALILLFRALMEPWEGEDEKWHIFVRRLRKETDRSGDAGGDQICACLARARQQNRYGRRWYIVSRSRCSAGTLEALGHQPREVHTLVGLSLS
jgi:hypothetical protein